MRKRRLLKLAELLEIDANKPNGIKFDMNTFGRIDGLRASVSCGTEACAMGLAAVSRAFRDDGLSFNSKHASINFLWNGKPINGYAAAKRLFKINDAEVKFLFGSNTINRWPNDGVGRGAELAVAKRIRDFVAGAAHP